jgi:NAD(P)-dependent dehydrogenase (short-subunit alcohol dehydrogenase family)
VSRKKPSILITGGSRGIGSATALAAAAAGYPVAVVYRAGHSEAAAVVRKICDRGGSAIAIQADVTSEFDIEKAFDQTEAELGRLGALVNNAGVTGGHARAEHVTAKQVAMVLSVNVAGTFLCARAAIRRMATDRGFDGGSIVNVSSKAACTGAAGVWVHYAASKGALDAMTVGLAKELAPSGIRVNGVRPGLIDTEIHAQRSDDSLARLREKIPLGRMGTAEEVAAAIIWLLSDEASYVTGATLDVAGGA